MKTLEQYMKENLDDEIIDHAVRASRDEYGTVRFYIHPDGHDGDTLDFRVRDGNVVVPITNDGFEVPAHVGTPTQGTSHDQ